MQNSHSKRKYHPLIIILYSSGMLDQIQLKDIPRNTRWRWNNFNHSDYYGHELVEDYTQKFDEIKNVYSNKYLFKATRFMCSMSAGFNKIISEFEQKKSILRKNALDIIASVDRMRQYSALNTKNICRIFGVSRDWYYRHRNQYRCSFSIKGRCYKQSPNQLTANEIITIGQLFNDLKNANKSKTTIYYDALNNKIVSCAKSTFCKYARDLGYITTKSSKSTNRKTGFKAKRPFEWLHVDITQIPTLENGMQKVAFVKDNYSSAILHYKSTDQKAGSVFIKELFEETFEKYDLFNLTLPINIVSDGGSENKGFFLDWINEIKAPPVVRKLTAQSDEFPYSNSMSEITHKLYKSEFMQGRIAQTKHIHDQNLETFVIDYNQHRYMGAHFGYTPMEVLNGKFPDKNRFKEQIREGQFNRLNYKLCVSIVGCK
jgi:transposase InsO family protein